MIELLSFIYNRRFGEDRLKKKSIFFLKKKY